MVQDICMNENQSQIESDENSEDEPILRGVEEENIGEINTDLEITNSNDVEIRIITDNN